MHLICYISLHLVVYKFHGGDMLHTTIAFLVYFGRRPGSSCCARYSGWLFVIFPQDYVSL